VERRRGVLTIGACQQQGSAPAGHDPRLVVREGLARGRTPRVRRPGNPANGVHSAAHRSDRAAGRRAGASASLLGRFRGCDWSGGHCAATRGRRRARRTFDLLVCSLELRLGLFYGGWLRLHHGLGLGRTGAHGGTASRQTEDCAQGHSVRSDTTLFLHLPEGYACVGPLVCRAVTGEGNSFRDVREPGRLSTLNLEGRPPSHARAEATGPSASRRPRFRCC
jgi:hypothetical protein